MFVERTEVIIKEGAVNEALAILGEMKAVSIPSGYDPSRLRLYRCGYGPRNAIAWEIEFEDNEDRAKFWAEMRNNQEYIELRDKVWKLVEPGGINELWWLR